jgi:hypothetical protein
MAAASSMNCDGLTQMVVKPNHSTGPPGRVGCGPTHIFPNE